MKNLLKLTLLMTYVLVGSSGAFKSEAQVFTTWNNDKAKAFQMAKQQDKYIFLFVGHSGCGYCQRTSDVFTTNVYGSLNGPSTMEGPLKKTIDENYIQWYSYSTGGGVYASDVKAYVDAILALKPNTLPLVAIIDPNVPDVNVDVKWSTNSVAVWEAFFKLDNLDLMAKNKLKWYTAKAQVFDLAQLENKYVFKFVGKSKSPNSQKIMKLLNESPLKELLEERFILWFSDNIAEANLEATTYAEDGDEEVLKTLPYISIFYKESSDIILEESWGATDVELLETTLSAYTVSNEKILPDNTHLFILGNSLFISNLFTNERINVFSLTGTSLASVYKNDFSINIDASNYPKGSLIIQSSAGWSAKVFNP